MHAKYFVTWLYSTVLATEFIFQTKRLPNALSIFDALFLIRKRQHLVPIIPALLMVAHAGFTIYRISNSDIPMYE